MPGPTHLPPPPQAGQDQATSFTTSSGERTAVVTATTSASSAVHDTGPVPPRRPADAGTVAGTGSHSRSSSLDNQLIDLSDAGHCCYYYYY